VQQSLVQALRGDQALVALLGGARVHDLVPPDTAYPFVSLGAGIARDWSTSTEIGCEHLLTLHVWSKAGGRKEILRIMNEVRRVLAAGEFELGDHRLVNLWAEYEDARLDDDGETYHGVLRCRAVTEAAA
jgi:hypothetical protein